TSNADQPSLVDGAKEDLARPHEPGLTAFPPRHQSIDKAKAFGTCLGRKLVKAGHGKPYGADNKHAPSLFGRHFRLPRVRAAFAASLRHVAAGMPSRSWGAAKAGGR